MIIRMDELIRSLAIGLDAVEGDFLGASTNHGNRIATLCSAMASHLGLPQDERLTIACCALLHDNALTEYILSERPGSAQDFNMHSHCTIGQKNAECLPFPSDMKDLILYHHERADGSGPFGINADHMPLGAQLIAISDLLDSTLHFQRMSPEALPALIEKVRENTGTQFSTAAADAFLAVMDEAMLESLRDEVIEVTMAGALPAWEVDVHGEQILSISAFVRRIIDYKSEFTKHHSTQVANIAWQMARYYGYDSNTCAMVYWAGSLHDLGKLFVPTGILEKPGFLTDDEYQVIQTHVWWTREMLGAVTGMEKITEWAANHHEKLDGKGYPLHVQAEGLDDISRILACADIYQAIADKRPYHDARTHKETIEIVTGIVDKGELDGRICADMAQVITQWPVGQVPPPESL